MNTKIVIAAVIGLVIGGAGGYLIPHGAQAAAARGNFTASRGGPGAFGRSSAAGPNGGGFLAGTIAKTDSESITLNTRDGSSHLILITPQTDIEKSVSGTQSDLATGQNVMVTGTTNSDGSLSANLVQIRPANTQAPMIPAQGPQPR